VSQDSAEEPAKSSPKKVPSFHIPEAPKGYDFNMDIETGVAYRIPNASAKHFPFFIDYEGNIVPRDDFRKWGATSGNWMAQAINEPKNLKPTESYYPDTDRDHRCRFVEPVYEYRSGALVPGNLDSWGNFVPTVGEKIIALKDYEPGKKALRIYNLPGELKEKK
jgi:hypothetical protein